MCDKYCRSGAPARRRPELAANRTGLPNRNRYGDAAVQTGDRPKSVPEPRRSNVNAPDDGEDSSVNADGPSALLHQTGPGCDRPAGAHRTKASLEADARQFSDDLLRRYGTRIKRRPKAFKSRVLALIRLNLPPYPKPRGRPRQLRVTRAAEMYAKQLRERDAGTRKQITWQPIARRCVAGFAKIRSAALRRAEIGRLRDAVYARRRHMSAADLHKSGFLARAT
jgi:hypothetical protein